MDWRLGAGDDAGEMARNDDVGLLDFSAPFLCWFEFCSWFIFKSCYNDRHAVGMSICRKSQWKVSGTRIACERFVLGLMMW